MRFEPKLVRAPALPIEFEVLAGDAFIGPAIERGVWEEHETRLFRAHAEAGSRVLDLGANVGWFSVQAILCGCDVVAFEPVPEIAAICQRNIERAMKVGRGRGQLLPFAAGAVAGSATIALSPKNFGDNRVLDEGAARPKDMERGEELAIRLERVDDHVTGPVRVIKIDTQGSEWLALQGARRLLDASPRVAMLLEFWPYALRGAQPEELLAFLCAERFEIGKATAAPYPMSPERILRQARARDPVKGGLDLYATRGVPFHVGGFERRVRSIYRRLREP
ncbi:MAG: FkbM family methyltransferase [Planctomycetota bacterium]